VNLAGMPEVDVLLAHQVWQEQMDINHEASFTQVPARYAPCSLATTTCTSGWSLRTCDWDSAGDGLLARVVGVPGRRRAVGEAGVRAWRTTMSLSRYRSAEMPSRAIFRYQLTTQGELEWFCGNVLHDVKVGNPYATHPVIGKPIVEVKFALSMPDASGADPGGVRGQRLSDGETDRQRARDGHLDERRAAGHDPGEGAAGRAGRARAYGRLAAVPVRLYRLLQGGDPLTTLALDAGRALGGRAGHYRGGCGRQ
jgi:hypothetical protein